MKTIIRFLFLLLLLTATLAMAQGPIGKTIPTCNAWDATNTIPVYNDGVNPATTMCTDYFGKANYANSPLPKGSLDISATGFTIMDGGSGYTAPTVTIDDFYGTVGAGGAVCTASLFGDAIGGITCSAAGAGYRAPVVTISDPTGSGAIVMARLDPTTVTGGIKKFQDAVPDLKNAIATANGTFAGADYYEVALVETTWPMHSNLPPTTVRGYVQVPAASFGAANLDACTAAKAAPYNYLGPVILAAKNRPVRVKFINCLPVGTGGDLFIPTDTTYMGAGMGPDGMNPYLQSRATLHLHGGNTPWISDGTPHQWTIPVGESSVYPRGDSTRFVPDMWYDASGVLVASCAGQTSCAVAGATNDPGQGAMTFYWTNEQTGRLMFYHDHAYGTTRLNVYVGEAAGYLLYDPTEEAGLLAAGAPGTIATNTVQLAADLAHLIPLVIQDKTFVPSPEELTAQDPTWIGNWGKNGVGDLWFPHVYNPNQNPADLGGSNAFGRWDYGPWFFPPQTALDMAGPNALGPHGAVTIPCTSAAFPGVTIAPNAANNYKDGCPIFPNPSGTPEGFMDTPVINGKAYPVLHVAPEAYRFRILNAANDRAINISLYKACGSVTTTAANCVPTATGTEVPMVPAVRGGLGTTGYTYPDQLDGRDAGVPDRGAAGPSWLQIGTEGGILPNVAIVPPSPIGFEYGRRSITVLNISNHGLLLGPAERADAVVDFTGLAGKTLILYNDAPAPVPAFDSRIDYYTNDPDQVQEGGAPTTVPGYGPNTRTMMQIIVDQPASGSTFSQAALQAGLPAIFGAGQPQIIVPEPTYPVASNGNSATATYGKISDDTITFTPVPTAANPTPTPTTYSYDQKAIQELFTLDYGRMNATLGTELPLTNFLVQTTLPYGYAEWATEIMQDGQTQIWKLTHNGVDTHFIHFHLFNVQVINRIGWDGVVKPPDANELGWKDTVRMNPLEDIVFAIQPFKQVLPWPVPDSVRLLDPTMPAGTDPDPIISGIDPATGNAIPGGLGRQNALVNFGQEYVWHCHILGHEENDMMRPIIFQAAPWAPTNLVAFYDANGVTVSWTDASASESAFNLEKSFDQLTWTAVGNPNASSPSSLFGQTMTFSDAGQTQVAGQDIYYRLRSVDDFTPQSPLTAPFQPIAMTSAWVVAKAGAATTTTTITSTNSPITYGQNAIINVNVSSPIPTPAGNVSLTVGTGTPIVQALDAAGNATFTVPGLAAGTYPLTVNYAQQGIYLASSTTGSFVVNQAAATVTVAAAGKVFGTADPNPLTTATLTGFLPADNVTASFTRTAGESVGVYPITATLAPTAVLSNYTITFNNANFTITGVPLTITATSMNKAYGAPLPALTVSAAGLVTPDTLASLSFVQNCTTTATAASPVGPYPIDCSASTINAPNYVVTYVPGTLTVTALAASVTPNAASKIYGQADPVFTGTLTGFLPADGVTATYTRTAGNNAGVYTISATLAPAAVLGNYNITYNTAAFTINAATSTTAITAHTPSPSNIGVVVTVSFRVTPQIAGSAATGNVSVTASTGESCTGTLLLNLGTCQVTFTTPGLRTLVASYAGDGNVSPSVSPAVSHIVTGPLASVSPASLVFANQLINTNSPTQSVTLANTGNGALTISSVTFAGPFSRVAGGCGTTLQAARTCTITVRFRPTATGAAAGTMTINSNDPIHPALSVALSGTGVAPVVALSPTSLTFPAQTRGTTSAPQTVTLTNSGTYALIINTISVNGGNAANFIAANQNCPIGGAGLAPGAFCTVNVSFRPNARGTRTSNLRFSDNAVPNPQLVPLSGIGQ